MARPITVVALLALISLICYQVIMSALDRKRFARFVEANAYRFAPRSPAKHGFARIFRLLNAGKTGEDILDDIFADDFTEAFTVSIRTISGGTSICTTEPANLRAVLATQFQDFESGKRRYYQLRPLLGRSIFSSDGQFWEHSRALFRPQFSRENINDLQSTEEAAAKLITAFGPEDESGWTTATDVMPLLYNFTLDTITDFLFGESVDSQSVHIAAQTGSAHDGLMRTSKEMQVRDISNAFDTASKYLVTRIRLQSLYWLGDSLAFRRATAAVKTFTDSYVQLTLDAVSSGKAQGTQANFMTSLANQTRDREVMRNQSLALLLAGRDTTAALVGWCLVYLAMHPHIFSTLRDAVIEVLRKHERITFATLKSCRYLQHVLNETLRLNPPVPVNFRYATRDTSLPQGGGLNGNLPVAMRKGDLVLFNVHSLHRRRDLWGEDALEFKPDRWQRTYPAWQYLPFSGGPRICLGQQYALTEAGFVLVKILREFDAIEAVDLPRTAKMRKGLGLVSWPLDARFKFKKIQA